jgi:proton glutamate symport protein
MTDNLIQLESAKGNASRSTKELSRIRRLTLPQWILVGMVVGILIGQFPEQAKHLQAVSTLFLNLIKCIIVPLVFTTLIVGIAGHTDDMKAVGRLAVKTILYFEIITTLALFIGLAAVNLVRPGDGIHLTAPAEPGKQFAATKVSFDAVIGHLAPQSLFDSAARNDVLQVVLGAIVFGVALGSMQGKHKQTILGFFEGLSEVTFTATGLIMRLAPFGCGAAIAVTIGQNGLGVLLSLCKLVLTLYGALAVFVFLVLVPVMLLARIPVLKFFETVREPALLAFSTASSEAALPIALRLMEKFGVPRRIVSLVMPAGYAFNLDGSTLYLSVAAIFVAQAAGLHHLTLSEQMPILLALALSSKGVAAVPRASLVILSGTLATFGLPLEGVAVILGVDAFLDMGRTSINLVGNCLASAVIARWEGELTLFSGSGAENSKKS